MKTQTRPYDVTEYFRDGTDMAGHLDTALADGHPAVVATALGDAARAVGMSLVARRTGLGRESLYKALSPAGNPEFATVLRVIAALGFRLTVVADDATPTEPARERSARLPAPGPRLGKPPPRLVPRAAPPAPRGRSARKSPTRSQGRPRLPP